MPQSAQEWYEQTRRRIDSDGCRSVELSELVMRRLVELAGGEIPETT
jgi:hypothetical protein